jgi:enoyl-CoA hydratase/carnithine racemase
MSELITVTITNHVADVRLNRADKMNALNLAMFNAISDLGKQLSSNRDIRAVVLSGEGKAFCAGLDLANFSDPAFVTEPFGEGRGGFYPNFYQSPAFVWKAIPVPVICALQGVAFGGGLQIALGADIRIAHPQTQFSVMEIKWGLIPDMSASQTLRDLVRLDVAKELTFSGRVVAADEAQALGLITSIDDQPREAALKMANDIANRNPDAISYSKYLLDNSWHGDQLAGLQTEERLQAKLLKSNNQIEAVTAAMEKRTPQFKPRAITSFKDLDTVK